MSLWQLRKNRGVQNQGNILGGLSLGLKGQLDTHVKSLCRERMSILFRTTQSSQEHPSLVPWGFIFLCPRRSW